jgi:hypothetical protein
MALAPMITAHPTFAGGGRATAGKFLVSYMDVSMGKSFVKAWFSPWYSWMFQLCSLEVIQLKLDGFMNPVLTGGSSLKSILG